MESNNELAAKRFKQLRDSFNLTQKQFADALHIRNTIADIERGRTKISGYIIAKLMQLYDVNPMWLYGLSAIKNCSKIQHQIAPKVITVDNEENENMLLVDAKAAAGYPTNISEPLWYNELPAFNFPLPQFRNASFRGFQIQGDSMFPQFKPKEWVIAKAVEDIKYVSNNRIHVIVLKDSVLIKQLEKDEDNLKINLISTNNTYPKFDIQISEIQEIWEVVSKLSFDVQDITDSASIHDLQLSIKRLSKEVEGLKK